jgi:hypothetical protein
MKCRPHQDRQLLFEIFFGTVNILRRKRLNLRSVISASLHFPEESKTAPSNLINYRNKTLHEGINYFPFYFAKSTPYRKTFHTHVTALEEVLASLPFISRVPSLTSCINNAGYVYVAEIMNIENFKRKRLVPLLHMLVSLHTREVNSY